MVRTAKFSEADFVSATMALVAEGGPAAATMQAIARRVGAPTGSIYHRFASRSAVLSLAWNTAYASFTARLGPLLRAGQPRDAAMAILDWVRDDVTRARFLLLNEPAALFEDSPPPPDQIAVLESLQADFDAAFQHCLSADGADPASDEWIARARFLVFDGPVAILRPYLQRNADIPDFARQMISDLHRHHPPGPPAMTTATSPHTRQAS